MWVNLADPTANGIAWELASAMRHLRHMTELTARWALHLQNPSSSEFEARRCMQMPSPELELQPGVDVPICFPRAVVPLPSALGGTVFESPGMFRELARQKCFRQVASVIVQWEYIDRVYTMCGASAASDVEL